MSGIGNLMIGIWYGEKPKDSIEDLRNKVINSSDERELILNLTEILKLGDFSVKNALIQLMNNTKDEATLNLCIRVFCSVATHDDIRNVNNLKFLGNIPYDALRTFITCSTETLSYEVVPYLLAILEEWNDVEEVVVAVKDALDLIVGYENILGEDASIDDIGEYYLNIKNLDAKKYYYEKNLAFPGDLSKMLIERAMVSMNKREMLKMAVIPTLLSIWSGNKCPVEYDTIISDDSYRNIISYVKVLSDMDWKKGEKYFYGYNVE
ncbi:Imm47 family immunity protein [Brevibacillus laterosporus]|uniref:Imm47 family immunity protein n=1 Tax=Brevibacillus laterosporus TaxID=1465 RepID=UPI000CE4F42C|nr:Imm47 family immunity protein [Brevibacillus laterosporus]MED1666333.1 Imm47 family immunity protein [Brevibacillus laterosporus]MED1668522.1 Imm47 family immunity protein [Brevibacillus laterosporus]MED1719210.1 Imm47 family immunity protein [Brevibacillus laterosporus]PPA80714.1 hypothetical protein C4A76_25730 [Brevibacillus laterosporus]